MKSMTIKELQEDLAEELTFKDFRHSVKDAWRENQECEVWRKMIEGVVESLDSLSASGNVKDHAAAPMGKLLALLVMLADSCGFRLEDIAKAEFLRNERVDSQWRDEVNSRIAEFVLKRKGLGSLKITALERPSSELANRRDMRSVECIFCGSTGYYKKHVEVPWSSVSDNRDPRYSCWKCNYMFSVPRGRNE